MTNKQAINILSSLPLQAPSDGELVEIQTAVKMAIKALEHGPYGKTECVTIYDRFGNKISGYMDETRNLIFSHYGIVTLELLLQKQYTVIKDKEFGGGRQ